MVERGHKPGALSVSGQTTGTESQVVVESNKVKLSLPSGESAEILLHGATVISWIADGEERLFLSDKAKLDGSKAVRGGIPLVFPVFGKATEGPTAALPQHGFARISKWELLGKGSESETSVQVDFGLGPHNLTVDSRKQWPYDFGLIYSVTLSKSSLETKLLVRNEGHETFDFNVLFHTYLRVPDVTSLKIQGLKGVTYKDKVAKGAEFKEENSDITVSSEIDRVYAEAPESIKVISGDKTLFKVDRTNLEDVVVWNPWEGAATNMGDFGPSDGYKNMMCIEAGAVSKWHSLEPQNVWEAGTVISI